MKLATPLAIATLVACTAAWAGPFDNLKQAATADLSNATTSLKGAATTSALSQLQGGSFSLASPQNVAGVLGYCQKQGWAPSATDTVKNQLMQKFGLQTQANQNADYQNGLNGVLQGAQNGTLSLSGLKDSVGKKVCGSIADKALSSFL